MGKLSKLGAGISFLFALGGCATGPGAPSEIDSLKNDISQLQKNQSLQSAQIYELTQKLAARPAIEKTQPVVNESSTDVQTEKQTEKQIANQTETPTASLTPKVNKKPNPVSLADMSGAERLYKKSLNDAKLGHLVNVQKNVDLLLKGYKESPWTNNAIYLLGEKFFEKGMYLKAAEQFETLYKTFPDGNKAVSALYKLGECYQKLGKPDEALEAFQNVVSVYPGSKEASMSLKKLNESPSKGPRKKETQE
jgi:TolA-binding protein